jgi:hypothetical protein
MNGDKKKAKERDYKLHEREFRHNYGTAASAMKDSLQV